MSKNASVWLRPTKSSPVCRYSYDPEKGSLTSGRRMFSDCGVWLTFFVKDVVVVDPTTDVCPFCKLGHSVAPQPREPTVTRTKKRGRLPLRYLPHDA